MARLDWPGMLRTGLVRLRLRPAEFWALTPAELMLMLGLASGSSRPMARERLAELVDKFPDRPRPALTETRNAETGD